MIMVIISMNMNYETMIYDWWFCSGCMYGALTLEHWSILDVTVCASTGLISVCPVGFQRNPMLNWSDDKCQPLRLNRYWRQLLWNSTVRHWSLEFVWVWWKLMQNIQYLCLGWVLRERERHVTQTYVWMLKQETLFNLNFLENVFCEICSPRFMLLFFKFMIQDQFNPILAK